MNNYMSIYVLLFSCIFSTEKFIMPQPFIIRSCQRNSDCQNIIENSECYGQCRCPENKILSSDGSKCLEEIKYFGDACEDNVQCSESLLTGGVCINKICKCKEGFHFIRGRCWKNVDLNESCFVNEQCFSAYEYIGLECQNNKCQCRTEYYKRLDSGCRRRMGISKPCILDSDCPKGVACNNMICSNIPIHSKNVNESFFRMKTQDGLVELGAPCHTEEACYNTPNAVCLDHDVCACKPPMYVASENNKKCLQSALGKVTDIEESSCEENAQCAVFGGNSMCNGKHCACKNGTYWAVKHQFCWTIRFIGEKCSVTEDCHPTVNYAECKRNVCMCQKGYHEKGLVCQRDATKTGDYCEKNDECLLSNSFCNASNACACMENYYSQKGKCVGGIKSDCETDAECCHLKNAQCRKSNSSSSAQCLCLDDYVSSLEGKYCLPAVKFGGMCKESFQCTNDLGEFGECRDEICKCQNISHYSYGKCYRSKFTKEGCTTVHDCHPGNDASSIICLNGSCSCTHHYDVDERGFCVKANSSSEMKPFVYGLLAALLLFR